MDYLPWLLACFKLADWLSSCQPLASMRPLHPAPSPNPRQSCLLIRHYLITCLHPVQSSPAQPETCLKVPPLNSIALSIPLNSTTGCTSWHWHYQTSATDWPCTSDLIPTLNSFPLSSSSINHHNNRLIWQPSFSCVNHRQDSSPKYFDNPFPFKKVPAAPIAASASNQRHASPSFHTSRKPPPVGANPTIAGEITIHLPL